MKSLSRRHLAFALLAAAATPIHAQGVGGSPDMAPINQAPNPYKTIEGWAKMPEGRTWGSTSAVAIDKDGQSIWVAERCGQNNCLGSQLDPVLHFDANGNLLKSFGAGLIQAPHGIFVDKDDNIWVVDCSCTFGGGRGRRGGGAPPAPVDSTHGHQIFEFSPDGKLLRTLGRAGGGRNAEFFFTPNAVYVAPDGSIFVAEGHSSQKGSTARLFKFSKEGQLVKTYGSVVGGGPDSLNQPHALAMDSKGRLFVGDRANNRIIIMDQDFNRLDTWYQFSRPSGIFIDKNDNIYVADSESQSVDKSRTAWMRGIRIGSLRDGKVQYFIPDPLPTCPQGQPSTAEAPCANNTSAAEGVAVDSKGVIYGAEVGPKALKRYVKQ